MTEVQHRASKEELLAMLCEIREILQEGHPEKAKLKCDVALKDEHLSSWEKVVHAYALLCNNSGQLESISYKSKLKRVTYITHNGIPRAALLFESGRWFLYREWSNVSPDNLPTEEWLFLLEVLEALGVITSFESSEADTYRKLIRS